MPVAALLFRLLIYGQSHRIHLAELPFFLRFSLCIFGILWFGLVWFGLVAAKTESAAIYFIATLASAAIASADVAATATAAARLVQVDSSTWRGLHAQ